MGLLLLFRVYTRKRKEGKKEKRPSRLKKWKERRVNVYGNVQQQIYEINTFLRASIVNTSPVLGQVILPSIFSAMSCNA